MGKQSVRRPPASDTASLYEDDFYTWVQNQIGLLRSGRLTEIDALNVAEELSDVGNEQLDKLESAIAVLTQHLLKWDHQPAKRSRSWELSVREQRRRIERVLSKNPGLKPLLPEAIRQGYADGRDRALAETDLPDSAIPADCPYSFQQMMERDIEVAQPR